MVSFWSRVLQHEWLVEALLTFFKYSGDDVHHLWLFAIEDDNVSLRSAVERCCAVSVSRARNMAIVHSWWTALLKISQQFKAKGPRQPLRRAVQKETVDRIVQELDRLEMSSHPHRKLALMTAVGPRQRHSLDPPPRPGVEKYDGSDGIIGPLQPFLIYAAAQRGLLESVVWLHEFSIYYDEPKAILEAAKHGHFDVTSWLLDHVLPISDVTVAVHDRELGILAWQSGNFCHTLSRKWGFDMSQRRYDADTLAAKNGDVDGLRHVLAHPVFGPMFDSRVACAAAREGHLSVFEFLARNCRDVFKNSGVMYNAVANGHVEIAQWLLDNELSTPMQALGAFGAAIQSGSVEMLKWIRRDQGANYLKQIRVVYSQAWDLTNVEALAWLMKEDGFQVTTKNARVAMAKRDIAATKWIVNQCLANGALANNDGHQLVETAITTGNYELVRWFVEELGLWSPHAFATASVESSVEVLAFVYDSALTRLPDGMAAPKPACRGALVLVPDRMDTLAWLLQHGFREGLLVDSALDKLQCIEADHRFNQEQLGMSYRRSKFCDSSTLIGLRRAIGLIIEYYDPVIVRSIAWLPLWALQHGNLEALKWLAAIHHQTVFAPKLFQRVVQEYQNESILRWFLEQSPTLFSTRVVQWGVRHQKLEFLAWVFQTFLPRYLPEKDDAQLVLRRCTRTAICMASRRSRWDVLRGVRQWTTMANDPVLWHDV